MNGEKMQMSNNKEVINIIRKYIFLQKTLTVNFYNGDNVIGTIDKLEYIGDNPFVHIHDLEGIQTGYCPLSYINTIEYS